MIRARLNATQHPSTVLATRGVIWLLTLLLCACSSTKEEKDDTKLPDAGDVVTPNLGLDGSPADGSPSDVSPAADAGSSGDTTSLDTAVDVARQTDGALNEVLESDTANTEEEVKSGPSDAATTDAATTDAEPTDAGPTDAGLTDAGLTDAGPTDAGLTDAGLTDAGPTDAGLTDAGLTDAGPTDAGPTDAGPTDAGPTDAGPTDAGPTDAGPTDAGPTDAGPTDAGPTDAGPTDAGPTDAGPTDAGPTDSATGDATSGGSSVWSLGVDKVTISWSKLPTGRRLWTLGTTHPLRDNLPASKKVVIQEIATQPILRTGHQGLDAVYALALQESRENSAKSLKDNAFNQGKPVTCACFVTGEKWPWAWTRDVAYAVALGLGDVDPQRSATTLLFKTALPKSNVSSGLPKAGGGRQLVQDTGTGGSWPVSTDRVVWAVGAESVLDRLTGSARANFAAKAKAALTNTLATDRAVAWDAADGLYRGEESFLDWREQSYPSWAKFDLVAIANAKALSTNVLFWQAHRLLARLATEAGDATLAKTHSQHAIALGKAILKRFSVPGTPLLAALVGGPFDPSPTQRFELLGNALAVRLGLVTGKDALALLSAWPMSDAGPPVQWPQQPGAAIYHNRALWPFVTAWHAMAAAQAGHAEAVTRSLRSLTEFAALNLSHMENLEFLTGKNFVADGPLSGPVVNSRRQLWSVAGFIGAVHQVLFGMQTGSKGVRFRPALPVALRKAYLSGETSVTLSQLMWQGHAITVTLELPKQPAKPNDAAGLFVVASATLDGKKLALLEGGSPWLTGTDLGKSSELKLVLKAPTAPNTATVPTIKANPAAGWMAPAEPQAKDPTLVAGKIVFSWAAVAGADSYDVFRDGNLVASGVKAVQWTDLKTIPSAGAPCYAVAARVGAVRSHHSQGRCWWGLTGQRIQTLSAYQFLGDDGSWKGPGALAAHISSVGATGEALTAAAVHPTHTGPHAVQLVFRNTHGPTQTGIACATARVRVIRLSDDKVLADGRVAMPQQGGQFASSTTLPVLLDAKEPVRVVIDRGEGLINMSVLDHYTPYNGGPGGGSSLFSRFDLQAVKLLSWSGPATVFTPSVQPNGKDDLNKLGATQTMTPGALLASWERFAMTWDARFITVSVVSKAFEQGLKPFMLYLQVPNGAMPQAQPSEGMTYGKLTAKLPFTPTHVVTLRSQSDVGDSAGPWSGVHQRNGKTWSQMLRFEAGVDYWLATDKHTITVRIPRALLGGNGVLRMSGHIMWEQNGNEWKSLVPKTALPWKTATTGFYEVDLTKAPGTKSWALK